MDICFRKTLSQGVIKDPAVLDMLKKSSSIKNKSHKLSDFWNNTSMARVLDIFIENKDTWINIGDLMEVGSLSRRSIRVNTDILVEKDIIKKDIVKYYTFFKWNAKSTQAKHLDKLYNIL